MPGTLYKRISFWTGMGCQAIATAIVTSFWWTCTFAGANHWLWALVWCHHRTNHYRLNENNVEVFDYLRQTFLSLRPQVGITLPWFWCIASVTFGLAGVHIYNFSIEYMLFMELSYRSGSVDVWYKYKLPLCIHTIYVNGVDIIYRMFVWYNQREENLMFIVGCLVFTPWPLRPKGYCRCLSMSVCPPVCASVRKLYLVCKIKR